MFSTSSVSSINKPEICGLCDTPHEPPSQLCKQHQTFIQKHIKALGIKEQVWRKTHKLTLDSVASQCGISSSLLSKWEKIERASE